MDYSLLIVVAAGMMKMATGDDLPLQQGAGTGSRLVFGGYRGLHDGISDLGLPRGVLEYLAIYRAKRGGGAGGPRAGPNPPGRAWAPWRALVGCAPLGAPPRCSSSPLGSFWSIKNPQKVSRFGLRLLLISHDVKKEAKNSNWHLALGQ